MKRIMCLYMSIMLAAALLAGCGDQESMPGMSGQETSVQETASADTEPVTEATTDSSTVVTQPATETGLVDPQQPQSGILEQNSQTRDCFDIETPYGMLKYPLEWTEYVEIRQKESQGVAVVSFYGVLEDKEAQHLFDVIFGGEEGDYIGQILSENDVVPVFFRTYSVCENETLTTDESEMLRAMMEDINEVFNSLLAMENFQ